MNTRQIASSALLAPFLAFSAYVLATDGWIGFYRAALANPSTLLMGFDLLLALGILLVWMRGDARESGTPFAPYFVVTLALGVAGPLAYLIPREACLRRSAAPPSRGLAQGVHRA